MAQSLTGTPGNVESGYKIMSTNSLGNCVACHEIPSMPEVDFHGNIGPSLGGAAERYDEAHLRGIVMDAKQTFPGLDDALVLQDRRLCPPRRRLHRQRRPRGRCRRSSTPSRSRMWWPI